MAKIEMTIEQLESLLIQQKQITIERCLSNSYYYNMESTNGHSQSLKIDKEKFVENGMTAGYPNDFKVLKQYVK